MVAVVHEFPANSGGTSSVVVAVCVEKLTKNFSNVERALDDVSFDIAVGQSVALIGSDSAGKSTLLRCCAGIITPDAGKVTVFGQDLATLPARKREGALRQLAFLDGHSKPQGEISCLEYVLNSASKRFGKLKFWFKRKFSKSLREEACLCLTNAAGSSLFDRTVSSLSPLEAQQVALAAVMMQQPRLILADAPTVTLDRVSADKFMDLLIKYARESQRTLIFTSRELVDALAYADRAIALLQGRLELDAPIGAEEARMLRSMAS
ncbi:MAG: ATP-binding cassette domain-containing protein [Oligoflexia bacterium]|nr:ATP-binding cassette domain-containing protein [Oligoflexia bacterium]